MTVAPDRSHRGTIFVEDAEVITQSTHPGEQFILRVRAPECAQRATPGAFAHIRCDADIAMRRPLSIMRADPINGEVDFLYKIVGHGLRALSTLCAGDHVNIMGPIGNGFSPASSRPKKLMVGGGVGIPPMVFLAEHFVAAGEQDLLVLMGSEVPFPFTLTASEIAVAGISPSASHGIVALENIAVPSRLASLQNYAGTHRGYVTDLAREWLQSLDDTERAAVDMFACGPEPMLAAAAKIASEFNVSCQLSLEEYMACAVGGCAGCTVPVHLPAGTAMQRVCVDGPVFDARTIYPAGQN